MLNILTHAEVDTQGAAGAAEDAVPCVDRQAVLDLVAPAGLFEGQAAAEAGGAPAATAARARCVLPWLDP